MPPQNDGAIATSEETWTADETLQTDYQGTALAPDVASPFTGACATRIIEGTLDARLIAVDAKTGLPCADFGNNGQVDITVVMGETPPGYVSINRSEEHTSELQSLMRTSYAVFCSTKKKYYT